MLTFSRSRLTSLASKVDGVNMIAVKLQMEEDEFVPVGLDLGLTLGAAKDMGIAEDEKGELLKLKQASCSFHSFKSAEFTQLLSDSTCF